MKNYDIYLNLCTALQENIVSKNLVKEIEQMKVIQTANFG